MNARQKAYEQYKAGLAALDGYQEYAKAMEYKYIQQQIAIRLILNKYPGFKHLNSALHTKHHRDNGGR
jgi:hypothetical protein